MPDWKEQLQQIQTLRLTRQQNDDNVYAAKIGLLKADKVLNKTTRKETGLPPDEKLVADLRTKIAGQQGSLQQLNQQINNAGKIIDSYNKNAQLVIMLAKQVETTSAQLTVLRKQLADEQRTPARDNSKIIVIQRQLGQLQTTLKLAQPALGTAKNQQAILIKQEAVAQSERLELTKQVTATGLTLTQLSNQLQDQLTIGNITIAQAQQVKIESEDKLIKARTDFTSVVTNLQTAIQGIFVDPHPRALVSNLDDSIPFLLMPVRIETRFIAIGPAPELWLRVYPDDIAIHTHEKTLTDKEVREGEKYWAALFNAEKNGGEEKEDQKKIAWNVITSLFGAQRSAWIARQTRPLNWSSDLAAIADAASLDFPVFDLTKTDAWSRAPRTNIMPDKFVVTLYEGSVATKEVVGNLIPDELYMGPDPLDPEGSFVTSADNTLVFGESYNWTADFDKAVQCGMGFKIPLTASQAANGFDKIIVLGVSVSLDETMGKKTMEDLIDNHHYSSKGFSIVTQGTATNNTDNEASGFSGKDPYNAQSYFVETGDPLFTDSTGECDGKNLANALGIDYEPLQYIMNSDAKDHSEAVAANTALYPATLGCYFSTMMSPVLDDASQDMLRDFFVQHVSGRGPLPAIRVGNQPYGVLLTSDFSNWQWSAAEPVWGTPFLSVLQNVLNGYSNIYNGILPQLGYTGKPGVDPSASLLDILGLQPGSVSFFQRIAYSTDDLRNRDAFQYGGLYYNDFLNSLVSKGELLNLLTGLGYAQKDPTGNLLVPQQLRLVFDHYHTNLDASNLVDSVALSETDPISYYDTSLKKNYIDWLAAATTITDLEKQDFGTGIQAPNNLLYMLLRRARLLEVAAASVKWFGGKGIDVTQVIKPANFYNIRSGGTLTKWEGMRAKIVNAVPSHPQKDAAIGEYLLTTGKSEAEAVYLNKMTDALGLLSQIPGARLERCFTEHIDTCSYRLDSWQTAIFHQRLQKQRQLQNGSDSTAIKPGIFIGAYGWIENLRPESHKQVNPASVPVELQPPGGNPLYEYDDNGGFVQGPSLNHAIAAAILRSGYLNHASSDNPDLMAVNLSSERIRRAIFILDGIRNGQTLEALLGYQFERGLHDRGSQNDTLKILNSYIYNFRTDFPLKTHAVQQDGSDGVVETIPANNVVNGLDLAETIKPYPYAAIDFSGLDTATLQGVHDAIEAEKNKLQDSLDAVKDLLLSESVYQMIQGNFERTAAVTNALKNTDIPPEIDIINTPRSSRLTFTNRVTIQFTQDAGLTPAWLLDSMTARAMMESGLNNWIKKMLGEAEQLVCLVSHVDAGGVEETLEVSLDKLGLQPIDIIYISGDELNTGIAGSGTENRTGASQLESRIAYYYRSQKLLDDAVPVSIRFMQPAGETGKRTIGSILPLLRAIKSVVTGSRPLHAQDFCSPSKPGLVDPANPKGYNSDDLNSRLQTARGDFGNCLSAMNAIAVSGAGTITSLGDLFSSSNDAAGNFDTITIDGNDLQDKLIAIAAYGVPDAFPLVFNTVGTGRKSTLLEQAKNVAATMTSIAGIVDQLLVQAGNASGNEQKINILTQGAKALFGNEFTVIPLFSYNNAADIQLSYTDKDALTAYAKAQSGSEYVTDDWIQSASYVRPKLAAWEYIRTVYELLNKDNLVLSAVQLPYRAQDSWLAVEFPDANADATPFTIIDDTISVVIHGDSACFGAGFQAGLMVDDWIELIPSAEETTGISFNYNQPNAMAPQALLLAVPPVEKGKWSWDDLVGILNDTFLRAKLRAVEPDLLDKVNKPELSVLLPALMSTFSQNDVDISLDLRTNVAFYANTIPITSLAVS